MRSNDVWTQQAYVKASNTQQDNYFGRAVSLSANGNTLAVGAHDEKSDATEVNGDQTQNSNRNSGAAYLYTRQNNLWSQQAYLKAFREGSDACCFGGLGTVLSLSADGQTLAAGMQYRSERAIIFTQVNESWQQTATIESPNRQLDGDFGEKLSISGDGQTIAITAVGEVPIDEQGSRIIGTEEGVAYVFTLEEGEWQEQAYLYIEEHPNGRRFALDTDISSDGNTMAVTFNANRIYIYTRNEGTWTNVSILPDTTPIPSLSISHPRFNGNGDSMATTGGRPSLGEFGAYLF